MEFQKYGLFSHSCRFMEFHLYSIIIQFSYLLNSKNRHLFQNYRFVYFQEYFLFLKWTDFWNSNSRDYLVSIPISGIPKIWKFPTFIFQSIIQKCTYQNAMNNLTFYPQYKELVGYLFHFFHHTFEETLEVRDPQIYLIIKSFLENMEFT